MPGRVAEIRHGPRATPAAGAGRPARAGRLAAVAGGVALAGAMLTACSSSSDTSFSLFADPIGYQYYTCAQIAPEMKRFTDRVQELKTLMDKADQSAGGAAVGFIAYKAEYVAASEELQMLQSTARAKNCPQDPTWSSSTAIR